MRYYANPCSPGAIREMKAGRLGLIDTFRQGSTGPLLDVLSSPDAYWCADNGAFGASFDEEKWWAWLQRFSEHAPSCTFATAPDVVGKAAPTLERSLPWMPRMRDLGFPVALVGQDGLQRLEVPWDEFDAFFIGGSTAWKLSSHARNLATEAKERGKWVHMGRVNSFKRMVYAYRIGCDSVDGTFLTYGPRRRLSELMMWVEVIEDYERKRLAAQDHGHLRPAGTDVAPRD